VPFSEVQDCFWCKSQLRSAVEMVHCFICGFVSCERCASTLTGYLRLDGPFAHKTYCKHCKLALLHSTARVNLSPGTNPFTSFYSMPSFLLTESFFFRSAEARDFEACSSAVREDLIWVHYLPFAAVKGTGEQLPDVPLGPSDIARYFCVRSLATEALPLVKAILACEGPNTAGPRPPDFASWTVDDLLQARDTLHRSLLFALYVLVLKRNLPSEDSFNLRTSFSLIAHSIRQLHERLASRFQEERKFVSQAAKEALATAAAAPGRPEVEVMWGERMQRWKVGLMGLLQELESETSKLRLPSDDAEARAKRVLKYLKLEKQIKSLLVETSQLDKWTAEFPELLFLRNQLEPLRARAAHIMLTPPIAALAHRKDGSLPAQPPGLGGGQFRRLQEQMQSWSMEVQVLIAAVDKWEKAPAAKRGSAEEELSDILHQLEMLESRTTHMLVYCSQVQRLQPLGSHLNDLYLIVLHHLTRVRGLVGAASSSFALASVLEQEVLKIEMGVLQLRQGYVHISPEDMFSENDSVSPLFRKVAKLRNKAKRVAGTMLDSFGTGQVVPAQVVDQYRLRLDFCDKQLLDLETGLLNQFGVIIRSNPISAGLVSEPLVEKKASASIMEKAQQRLAERQLQAAKEEHELVETQMYDL